MIHPFPLAFFALSFREYLYFMRIFAYITEYSEVHGRVKLANFL